MDVRYNDECRNGQRSFSMTGSLWEGKTSGECTCGGCIHEELKKHFPDFAKFIKWHLTSEDGPMYYIENTTFHASQNKLDYARSTAVWPTASLEELSNKNLLYKRLPSLMDEFFADMKYLKSLTL